MNTIQALDVALNMLTACRADRHELRRPDVRQVGAFDPAAVQEAALAAGYTLAEAKRIVGLMEAARTTIREATDTTRVMLNAQERILLGIVEAANFSR